MISTVKKIYSIVDSTEFVYEMTKDSVKYYVPLDPANADYQAIQEWIADGNSVVDPNAD